MHHINHHNQSLKQTEISSSGREKLSEVLTQHKTDVAGQSVVKNPEQQQKPTRAGRHRNC